MPPFGYCLEQYSSWEYCSGGWIHNNVPYLKLQCLYIGRYIAIIVVDVFGSLPNCRTSICIGCGSCKLGPRHTNSPDTLQYLAPYIGATLVKYLMYPKQHTLIIYNDLSKQAQSYWQEDHRGEKHIRDMVFICILVFWKERLN